MFSEYGNLCNEVYDLTKPVGHSLGGDIEFYRDRLSSCQGRILEAAVGSGRLLIPLLDAGLLVDGVDSSAGMLASCRSRCAQRGLHPRLYQGRLQALSLPEKYEAIIVPASSFLLIEAREESVMALSRFHAHLVSEGRLILDIEFPPPNTLVVGAKSTSIYEFPERGFIITMESTVLEVDMLSQCVVSLLKYEKWQSGRRVGAELQRFAMRWYGVEEFTALLGSLGFRSIMVSADHALGRKPSRFDQVLTFECVRAQ